MLFFIHMNDRTKRIQQAVQRMLLVIPDFIRQFIESFDGPVASGHVHCEW